MVYVETRHIFAQRLRSLRKMKKLTQKELGNRLNLTEAAIGMWEQGRRLPDAETLPRLARILETSVDYLLGNDYVEKKDVNFDLQHFLESNMVYYAGRPLSDDEKEDLLLLMQLKRTHRRDKGNA
ncbi:helix-turn-helix domain-containing protein [Desulfurispora thermophila]|uniref:helix-turn-helix domain-containing protein n=1 Tax=Desulfurispora thermophila TaxID=265470 RepID=UPI0034A5CDBD